MSTMIKLSEAASLGLHTMRVLASDGGKRLTTRSIATRLKVSEAHLSKVLQRLVRRGLVQSTRGPKGGFTIAGDPGRVTLMSVYEAVDGPLTTEACFLGRSVCPEGDCMFGGLIETINNMARRHLEETVLADVTNGKAPRNGGADRHADG
jgi:Rrf2 family protein